MKKIISLLMSTAICFCSVVPVFSYAVDSAINIEEHTPQEIKKYVDSHPFTIPEYTYAPVKYSFYNTDSKPSTSYPYSAGIPKDSVRQSALNTLNCIRYIAGLQEVSLNNEYNELAQYASLVNCVNDELTHFPEQPSDMPDDIYNLGAEGACSSNICGGTIQVPLSYTVLLYMEDSDSSNIDRVGHRRWCLNPSMKETGFGIVDNYSAMYAHDRNRTDATETGVCWPARYTPIEYFDITSYGYGASPSAWSISLGRDLSGYSSIKVNVTRQSDSKEWNFSSSSADGDFYINNDYYGQTGCIIFRPSDISYSAGDVFDVKIEGMEEPVEYTVNFFSLSDISDEPVTYSLGDVNGDGSADAVDASLVLNEYSAISTNSGSIFNEEQKKFADVNSDDIIDSVDSSKILEFYSYISTSNNNISMEKWILQ